jgi:phospholipid/cholesterol/gamma-HCH transport system ATP-binding protein
VLQKTLDLTVFMVTHDLSSLASICDRVAALADGKIAALGSLDDVRASDHPWVRSYFHGVRAKMIHSPAA